MSISNATEMMQWERKSILFVIFLLKMNNTDLIVRKHDINSNWGAFYKLTGFKSIKDMKDEKKKAAGLSQIGRDYGQLNAIWDLGLYPRPEKWKKDIREKTHEIHSKSVDRLIVLYQC